MAVQIGGGQKCVKSTGGLYASQFANAPQRGLPSSIANNEQGKERENALAIIRKALQRLNLSAEEHRAQKALQAIQSKISMPRPAGGPTSPTELQLIRDKVRELAKAVTKLAIAPKA